MNKPVLFLILIIVLAIAVPSIIYIRSESSPTLEKWKPKNLLDVDFDVSAEKLVSDGFKMNEYSTVLSKKIGYSLVNYSTVKGRGIFDMSVIGIGIGTDSIKIADWTKSIGGFICSPIFEKKANVQKFFVKSFSSGQIFTGFARSGTAILLIDFPNTNKIDRSVQRVIKANGEVAVYDTNNEIVISRNDSVGF